MPAELQLESPPCPVCGGDVYAPVITDARDHIWRKPGVFTLARCEGCGLVATRPRPTPESLGFYYDDTYSGDDKAMKQFQTESALGRLVSWYRLKVISRVHRLGKDDRLLDVGCSYGGFLKAARDQSGCHASGIDLDEGSVASGLDAEHIDYRVGCLDTAGYPAETFTMITFMESLEHHAEPVAALREAYKLLKPGGVCAVEVPNFGGFWRRVFNTSWLPLLIPQHLFHFTPKTLRAAFKAAGFQEMARQQTMFYPLEGVASLGIALARLLRSPPPGGPFTWRTPFDISLFFVLIALWFVVEVPSQALLRLFGASGHQMAIARKPSARDSNHSNT